MFSRIHRVPLLRQFHTIYRSLQILVIVVLPFSLHARIVLPAFFSDNMVLQQKATVPIWGTADAGRQVTVRTSWDNRSYSVRSDASGRWKLQLNTPPAGGPFTITLTDGTPVTLHQVLIGEVWLCSGQSNMEMPMKGFRDQPIGNGNDHIFQAANNQLRLITIPRSALARPQDTVRATSWKMADAESVANFSATAYYFGKLLQEQLQVPVGLVHISYGGSSAEAWMSREALQAFPEISLPPASDTARVNNRTATALYNAMLHPFIGYGIRGCIWYQGESNYERPDQYEKLFPAMVQQWRNEFGQGDFPFYYVQIAPYNYAQLPPYRSGGKFNSAYLRDAQRKALKKIPNSGMVVLLDAGEENSIHPAQKEVVGKRLAYLTLARSYDKKGFTAASPVFDTMTSTGNVATIKFTEAPNGLTSYGKPLTQFEIAGSDKIFHPAQAVIYRGTVLVSSPEVKDPVAVRYAFRDYVQGELFNTAGLPVSSFRTDDW